MELDLATRLEKMKPCLRKRVESQQSKMWRSTRDRDFGIGDNVTIRDYRKDRDIWIPGRIETKTGPVSYRVEKIAPCVIWRRHADQIRSSNLGLPSGIPVPYPDISSVPSPVYTNGKRVSGEITDSQPNMLEQSLASQASSPENLQPVEKKQGESPPVQTVVERRYPTRIRKKVDKLDL